MATRTLPRYMLHRPSGFYARRAVPAALRPVMGVRELLTALGPDYRVARDRLKHAVADHQRRLDHARGVARPDEREATRPEPYTPDELARVHQFHALQADHERRDRGEKLELVGAEHIRWGRIGGGKARDDELVEIVEPMLAPYRAKGLVDAEVGTPEWRAVCRRIGMAQAAAHGVILGREANDPVALALLPDDLPGAAIEAARRERGPSLKGIFAHYLDTLERKGSPEKTRKDFARTLDAFRQHVGHDDAAKVNRKDVVAWADKLVADGLKPQTVNLKKLAPVATAFRVAVDRDDVQTNPAAGYRLDVARVQVDREKGYTADEAAAILKASSSYRARTSATSSTTESVELAAAKRWLPMLAHYTGARLVELAQLRREDVGERDGLAFVRITPNAGSVKSGKFRDVPLARAVLDAGFLDFVGTGIGPLFHKGTRTGAATTGDRVSDYVKGLNVADGVQPIHGFRHAFKTIGHEAGVGERVLDAIQGHSPRTAGEGYGDVTLKAKARALDTMFGCPQGFAGRG